MKQSSNIAYVIMPHFKTNCLRAAEKLQQCPKQNFIVVCCSPGFNGVYRWDKSSTETTYWLNKNTLCLCVPMDKCEKIKDLKDLTNPDIIKQVRKIQKKWIEGQVENNERVYKEKPDWLI